MRPFALMAGVLGAALMTSSAPRRDAAFKRRLAESGQWFIDAARRLSPEAFAGPRLLP
jgi:hypothetical protein